MYFFYFLHWPFIFKSDNLLYMYENNHSEMILILLQLKFPSENELIF